MSDQTSPVSSLANSLPADNDLSMTGVNSGGNGPPAKGDQLESKSAKPDNVGAGAGMDSVDLRVKLVGSGNGSKKRDGWEKADIIAKLLSTVLLAGVGLLINSSIQRSQMASAEANSRAQIEAARTKAQDDKRLQEGALTAQLVQHLASKDPIEREISIIALRESVPPQIYGAALLVLARSDPNKDVRVRAIENLPTVPSASVTKTLSNIASDTNRAPEERKAAEVSTEKAAAGQFVTGNSEIVFAAASPNSPAMEAGDLGHGVFTYFLLKGLSGNADTNRDGFVDSSELQKYLDNNVSDYTEGRQRPYVTTTSLGATVLSQPVTANSKIVVIGIGVSNYAKLSPLPFPINDVRSVGDIYKAKGSVVTLLTNADASKQNILNAIQRGTQALNPQDMLIIYFSGHGTLVDGKPMLIPYDASLDNSSTFLSVDDVKSSLTGVNAVKVFYLDTCFTSLGSSR